MDNEIAKDIAQDSFIKFWEARSKVKNGAEISYLYSIATNLVMNYHKHKKVVDNYASRKHFSSKPENPQFIMEQNEFNLHLEEAINSLTENQRVVFLMNRIDKLTYEKIANRLQISVKAVEKRMHGALYKLNQKLKRKL
ncbi:sigma-70 family RNA polymerase sigma factor [Cytophagales bacterium RKSG123]|nr:sigma-70 family RNA polymerase sigma factor [Xanthovirga aplysinae]